MVECQNRVMSTGPDMTLGVKSALSARRRRERWRWRAPCVASGYGHLVPVPEATPSADGRSSRWIVTVAWLTSGLLVVLSAMRVWGPLEHSLAFALVGVTPFVMLAAWPVGVLALRSRRRALFTVSAVLVVFQVLWTLEDANVRPAPDLATNEAPTVRIVTANLWVENDDPTGSVEDLLAADPDVIFLQEVEAGVDDALRLLPSLAEYEWRASSGSVGQGGGSGRVVFSRRPLRDLRVESFADTSSIVIASLDLGGESVEIRNVHLAAPLGPALIDAWRAQLTEVAAWHAERSGAVVVAGDFNATVHHQPFRELIEIGYTDAHSARGRGIGLSWRLRGIPLMRLDHVLTSEELEIVAVETLPHNGSDHRPVVVTLRLA